MKVLQRLFGPLYVEVLTARGNTKGLINALSYEKDEKIRLAAVRALGEIGEAAATETLTTCLKDHSSQVRSAAARSLGRIGDASAVGPLIVCLGDPCIQVQEAAAEALEAIGGPAVEPLRRNLRMPRSLSVRLACYSVLEQFPGENIPADSKQILADDVATEIRRLYSRTRTEIGYITTHTVFDPSGYVSPDVPQEVTRRDPDISGIHSLVEQIPETLRESVRARSGLLGREDEFWL